MISLRDFDPIYSVLVLNVNLSKIILEATLETKAENVLDNKKPSKPKNLEIIN